MTMLACVTYTCQGVYTHNMAQIGDLRCNIVAMCAHLAYLEMDANPCGT